MTIDLGEYQRESTSSIPPTDMARCGIEPYPSSEAEFPALPKAVALTTPARTRPRPDNLST